MQTRGLFVARWDRLAVLAGVVLLSASCAGYSYKVRTKPGPARALPGEYFGVAPGAISSDALKENGWALAETHEGVSMYVRGGSPEWGVSEAETIVSEQGGGANVDYIRLRYRQTRLATYRTLLQTLIDKYGPPQASDVQPSFYAFVLDPKSERPRPPRVIVHRWVGQRTDLVFVAGLEVEENLMAAMDYQLFLMAPTPLPGTTK